jgi:glucose-6-phosphate 1-epimerase
VLSWQTTGGDVLWTASSPEYVAGKPVRGGVPVVFPWFGDHKSDPSKPAHGFARSVDWQCSVRDARSATFSCVDTEATRAMWDFAFRAELTVTLGDTLQIAMTITNTDEQEFSFEQALHTYFTAGDIHKASVHGLENVSVVEHAREPEGEWDTSAPIRFRAETDRVYQQVPDLLSLRATTLGRTVTLNTRNSRSTIVWNPWPNKTARLSQMQADDWLSFVCIESANVGENSVTLAPGASHEMTLTLSVAVTGDSASQ